MVCDPWPAASASRSIGKDGSDPRRLSAMKTVQPNVVVRYNSLVGAGDRGSSADKQSESGASSIVNDIQNVSEPRRLSAALLLGQFLVLSAEGLGLLMPSSYHAGFRR